MRATGCKGQEVCRGVTSEGCNRTKSILQDQYGKESEIVKIYTCQISDLSFIQTVNICRVLKFSDKLMYAIQCLEKLKKFGQLNGCVTVTNYPPSVGILYEQSQTGSGLI